MKNIKAVILAGGLGTRLRPITCTRPKPMCEILEETVIGRIIRQLSECGIQKAAISTMYLSEKLCKELGRCICGVELEYVSEESPKGSAGGAKLAAKELGIGSDDIFVILSGDGVFDFSLDEAIKSHTSRNAEVTVVTSPSKNPLEYGVILTKKDGRIYSFTEKPGWSAVKSDSVNTGIYIINGAVFDHIPDDRPFDFSKDLYPHLLGIGTRLYSCELKGYWRDMGSISDYFNCCIDALSGRICGIKHDDAMTVEEMTVAGFEYSLPCYVSKYAEISKDSIIGAYSTVGRNTKIKGSKIDASFIFEDCNVNGCSLSNSIICENTVIEQNVTISQGCIIGAGCHIKSGAVLTEGVSIWPNKTIERGFCVTQDVLFDNKINNLYTDDGYFAGNVHGSINSEYITKLGRAVALASGRDGTRNRLFRNTKIGVMHDGSPASALICDAFLCGVKSAGAQGLCFMKGYEALARFAAYLYNVDYIAYITESDDSRVIKLFDSFSQAVTRELERTIESCFREAYIDSDVEIFETRYIDNTNLIYTGNITRDIEDEFDINGDGSPLDGVRCCFPEYSQESPSLRNLKTVLSDLGAIVTADDECGSISISVSDSGTEAFLKQKNEDGSECCLDSYHIVASLIAYRLRNGKETPLLPYSLASFYGKLLNSSYDNAEKSKFESRFDKKDKRRIVEDSFELTDMCLAITKLLAVIKRENATLCDLQSSLPPFEIRVRSMTNDDTGGEKRASIMKRLHEKYSKSEGLARDEGVRIAFDDGNVTVVPRRTGGFKLISESVNAECASELCDAVFDEIKRLGS